jgi:ribonuclease HI
LSVKKKKNKTVVEEQERKSKWEPPPVGWVKFNVDGSFVQQSGEAGIGVIARDSSVQVILTARRVLFRCQGAVEAEVRACREGFRLAAQWTQGPVIIESDCARIVQAMKEREDRSAISFILMEAKDQARLLPEWRVAKVRRECNLVANDLAQLAKRSMHTAVWLGRAPACVESTVANDCTPSN